MRVSVVQYLNTAPLVWSFTKGPLRGKYELSFTVPSECAEALRSGRADVAIIPAIEYQRIPGLVILPDLAIASKKTVRSLLLISKAPIGQVRSVALDSSSRSTQALTKILLERHWRAPAEFFEMAPDLPVMLEKADAALLIGDPALRVSLEIASEDPGPHADGRICRLEQLGLPLAGSAFVYDVVEQWRAMTGLPAVLAVWAAREEVVTGELAENFQASRDLGLRKIREISDEWSPKLALPARELERYLRENIDFTLDAENVAGLKRYFQEAAKSGLLSGVKELQLAGAGLLAKG